jgi:DNA-binding transcriptional MocR family regulator
MGIDDGVVMVNRKYMRLVNLIDSNIMDRKLRPGEKLLSIQELASKHEVSKNTVIRALHILENRGLIEARPKSGFFVQYRTQSEAPSTPEFSSIAPAKVSMPELFQDIILRGAAFDILPKQALGSPHHLLSKLHRLINQSMRNQAVQKSVYYDDPLGLESLREELSKHYQSVELDIKREQICITSGCQNALFLALMASCQPGDNVVIESPGFYGVIQLLEQLDLHAVEIPSSSDAGINLKVLKKVLDEFDIKACVVSPAFATPSGAEMSLEAKKDLVSLANQYDFAIIEDDIYGDLGFSKRPPPIKSLDTQERVILCSSFSKTLSRDLRIGWIMAGKWQDKIVKLKLVSNLACSQAVQNGLAVFLREGDYKRHLVYKRKTLEIQRNQLIDSISQYWGPLAKFYTPQGGLSIWFELPKSVDTHVLYNLSIAKGIVLAPGALFSIGPYFSNFMRLSFSHPTIEQREQAIKMLKSLIDKNF